MTEETFREQFSRLSNNWGESAYLPEALRIFRRSFRDVPDAVFVEAVDQLLITCRAKPMLKEIDAAIAEVEALVRDRAAVDASASDASYLSILGHAEEQNTTADPDFVKACMQLLRDKQEGKINLKQFNRQCDELDRLAEQLARNKGAKPCLECGGAGYTSPLGMGLHRCFCPIGGSRPATVKHRKPGATQADLYAIPQLRREMDFTQAADPRAARISDP